MDPIKISLNDYILSGGGANGESYDHKTDPSVMLKLYFPGKLQAYTGKEVLFPRNGRRAGKGGSVRF